MATAKPSNPVIAIEGMFNGCVMRIAQAIRDPANYGQSTKVVLTECAKRYHDALDDCEIQILDAKWYLEQQLALNQARREAKAREESAAVAKRKHDQIQEAGEKEARDYEAKKPKLETLKTKPVPKPPEQKDNKPAAAEPPKPQPAREPLKPAQEPKQPTPKPAKQPLKIPLDPVKIPGKLLDHPTEEPPSQTMTDFPQSTPQVTPAPTNDDFNFVSMFGEPSQDVGNADNENNDDMDFGLDLGDGFGSDLDGTDDQQNPSNLDSLLPGLESYANQPEIENNDTTNNNQAMNFELPPLDGPNDFDAFLAENDFGGGGGGVGGSNAKLDVDVNLTDEAMDINNIDFESMFA